MHIEIDLGDLTLSITASVHGLRPPRFVWRVSAPRDVRRVVRAAPSPGDEPFAALLASVIPSNRKASFIMDLKADQQVDLSLEWTDEAGNTTATPADASCTYTADDDNVITLTDNGDGTANAAATGVLGMANVHVDITAGGRSLSGDLQLVVVAGDAERVVVTASEPREVTPDV